jgi:hypothetical protein
MIKKLSSTEMIRMDKNLTIEPAASDLHHTAILIQYHQINILIPSGVDPSLLSNNINKPISIMVLNETDIENLPPDMWANFNAQTILWNSASVAPDPEWQGLDEYASIEIRSNGIGYSIHPAHW